MVARNVSATIGPTPGTVCSCLITGSVAVIACRRVSIAAISRLSVSINRQSGAMVSASGAGSASWATYFGSPCATLAFARNPACRTSDRINDSVPVPHLD